uniref:Serine/threonine-protein phosphatase 4 regulatory subunit 3-like central domain-containing protein n=1 Tax=Kalanchoe fedtschenkoi TaxID=63787 RepID=A0A7N0VLB4_KALFE
MQGGLIPKVLSLTQHEDVCLKTSAVVFLDTILKLNDKQVMDYLVEENIIRPLVDVVIAYERTEGQ